MITIISLAPYKHTYVCVTAWTDDNDESQSHINNINSMKMIIREINNLCYTHLWPFSSF